MKSKRLLGFAFSLPLLFACGPSQQESTRQNSSEAISYDTNAEGLGVAYYEDEEGYYVTDYRGNASALKLPETVEGDHGEGPLIGVCDYAFSFRPSLKALELSKSIRSVSAKAFEGSNIETLQVTEYLTDLDAASFVDSQIFTKEKDGVIYLPGGGEDYFYAIGLKAGATTFSLASSCRGIASNVFQGKTGTIEIGPNLHCIGKGNFGESFHPYLKDPNDELVLYNAEEKALYGCNAKRITIAPSVQTIGEGCFIGCDDLEELTVPFVGNKISYVNINGAIMQNGAGYLGNFFGAEGSWANRDKVPPSLKTLRFNGGGMVFGLENCESIETIDLGDNATIKLGNYGLGSTNIQKFEVGENHPLYTAVGGVVYSKDKTKLLACPTGKTGIFEIPATVTEIGQYAFAACKLLDQIRLVSPVETIGTGCFSNCKETIGSSYEGGLYLGDGTNPYAYFWKCEDEKTASISLHPNTKEILDTAFYPAEYTLKEVKLNDGLTVIGSSAFVFCQELESLTLPESVREIGNGAFMGCGSLTEITLPNSLEKLGQSAFSGSGIKEIAIPSKITEIPYGCFYGCYYLERCELHDRVSSLGEGSFGYCPSLSSFTLPASCTEIQARAFSQGSCKNGISVAEDNPNYRAINGMLYSKDGATLIAATGAREGHVDIPYGTETIGSYAFNDSSITSFSIPSTVKAIEDHAFYNCYNLSEVTIPGNVKTIGDEAFAYCRITSLTLENGVERMGENCIEHSIKELKLPASMIGFNRKSCLEAQRYEVDEANPYLSSSDGVLFDKKKERLIAYPYGNSGNWASYTVPETVKDIGDYAFYECYIDKLDLPKSLETIGDYAFCGPILKDLTLPASLKAIGYLAFAGYYYDASKGATRAIYYEGPLSSWLEIKQNNSFTNSGNITLIATDRGITY